MKSTIDCVHCYLKQAVSCMQEANIDVDTQHDVLYKLMDYVKEFDRSCTPAENSTLVVLKTYELIGVPDPYKEAKRSSNELALSLYDRLKALLDESDDRIYTALKLCVAGNIIDLGISRSFDIDESIRHSLDTGFSIDHYDEFSRKLEKEDECLILGDNSGEIVFDKILIEELNKIGKKVTYVVKGGPVLNDATMEDAIEVGLVNVAKVMTNGSNFLGTCLNRVSKEFLEIFNRAGLVIAKGQANFETLEGEETSKGRVFFLLKLKCDEVARSAGGEFGDVVFFTR